MSDIDENMTPQPTGVDPQSLGVNPSPEEFFVLSRIDGSATVAQICKTSGLGPDKTLKCIETLREHGLILFPGDEAPAQSPTSASTASDQSSSEESSEADGDNDEEPDELGAAIVARFPVDFEHYQFDEDLLEQQVEIDDDFKREVVFVYDHLDRINHYQLLGVGRDPGRRQLRGSYFKMSKRYHPDRFYQKILGDYEKRIEKIFQRVTNAYQVLNDESKRREYDEELDAGRTSHETPTQASTPASRRSEPREEMKGENKKKMAFKVLVRRGDEALEDGRTGTALKEYRKALTLHKDADLARRVSRSLLAEEQRLADALSFARAAHKIDGTDVTSLKLIGEILEKKGETEDALYHYRQALDAAGEDAEIAKRIRRLEQ